MQPINGRYIKYLMPSQSRLIAPYRSAPEMGVPGALLFDEDGDIFVTREELREQLASGNCKWDLGDLIGDIDEAERLGHFGDTDTRTVLVSIPYPGVAEWLSKRLDRPIHIRID